ncbi:hypothetical protein J3L18_22335 [Mucilaginibacter gossypii]|uniref:hypothetical protein n=1 Tax=Mucilaginibacter gossypii TaxID=551996 RepID=UPI000DCDD06D|nr:MULTISPECIES: hypothetical protein [Mucilaginibacter]QTE35865.1 hypothetical protein J3L18_22335 [Mucilaginibacter gossypii]RAV54671.1 hypothetical protein DIU36_20020 [Mucilaginibacter rubeus]
MKAISLYITVTLSIVLIGCKKPSNRYDTAMTVMIDETDQLPVYPTSQTLLAPFKLADNPWQQGLQITLVGITDKDVNTAKVVSLPKEDRLTGNITVRRAKVQRFVTDVQANLSQFDSTRNYPHSIIFRAIEHQATILAKRSSRHRYLLVYSNLRENSEVNFYNPQTLAVLQQHPDLIKKQFETNSPLPSLKGIQIWFLFAPKSYRENNLYIPIARFYEQVYKAHDADVHIETQFSLP